MTAERLDAFMARANATYYARRDPFADFTTAPEISQVFGELLGLWAAVTWTRIARPDPVRLIELGPGRGTLMRDALRAIGQAMPDFAAALRVEFVETSPRLREAQRAAVSAATWHDMLEHVPPGPFILLANEFLDALPIRQFVRRGAGWTERFVAEGAFIERAAPPPWEACPGTPVLADGADGVVVERAEAARRVIATIADRLRMAPGSALFLDYGPARSAPGDSLQALAHGAPTDPPSSAGEADLTAHVDFQALAEAAGAAGAAVFGPEPQGLFLARLGLFQRANRLAQGRPPREADAIMRAARRLGEPDAMGRLFKALVITRPGAPMPAGFEG
jgi:SAM-dependent MidA family methyltransferase